MVEDFIIVVQTRKTSPLEKDKLICKKAKMVFFLLNPFLILW